jgi:hypothetical protein
MIQRVTITAQGVNTLTFSGTLSNGNGGVVTKNNFAWGTDDTTAITNALATLISQSRSPGGTLFFPVSSGCYGLSSTLSISNGATSPALLAFSGEGSASSKQLAGPASGPGFAQTQPASACIATINQGNASPFTGISFATTNAGPLIERLGFLDPFGSTTSALMFTTHASTRVIHNSFQGYSNGTAIEFDAGGSGNYSQFVQASDNICVSVKSCIVMHDGITNPAWIERNRCVSAQYGGGRCVQLGPDATSPGNAGATNWIVENFAVYFPISYESIDQFADYWIGNSNQQTANLENSGNPVPNIIGGGGSGTGLHIGSSSTGTNCFSNELYGGNTTGNAVGLFIDAPCDRTTYLGYTIASTNMAVEDFGTNSSYWNPDLGMRVNSAANLASINAHNAITTTQLAAPGVPTVTPHMGASTTWNYVVCAKDFIGGSVCSSVGTTMAGPATLDANHYNTITWTGVPQASSYDVWRTSAGGSPNTDGLLGNVSAGTTTLTFRDNNPSGTPSPQCTTNSDCSPKVNTTSSIGTALNSAGVGYFVSTGLFQAQSIGSVTGTQVVATANEVAVTQFVLTSAATIGQVTISITATGATGSSVTIGIYDANGNKVFDTPTFDGTMMTTQTKSLVSPITIYPGTYYLAQSASDINISAQAITTAGISSLLNQKGKRVGLCANSAVAGVLPTVCFDATHALTTGAVTATVALFER